ncbi:MAG: hypothetical protein H0V66_11270 [Bdellovibrionales bacterium]|nr:hypothetical protein [Bdellovibrionales bacterium]
MKKLLHILPLVLLLSACGGAKSGGGVTPKKDDTTTGITIDLDATIEGQYLAVFETLNPQITSRITGAFTFSREKELDELIGDVRITNAGPKLVHAQNVRIGSRCPTLNDDTNGDGIIDAVEGEAVYGKILFPLDGDLATQSSHDGEFPMGDVYGNYIYARVTKFSSFIKDLRSDVYQEGYFKLKATEPLAIENRVVIVHGVDQAAGLPASVRSTNRFANYQSLPIVCGVIRKVMTVPGSTDEETFEDFDPEIVNENLIQP